MKECAVIGILGVTVAWALGCGGSQPEPQTPAPVTAPSPDPSGAPTPSTGAPASSAAPADSASPGDAPAVPASAGGEDTRTMEVIAALVKEHRKEARACYEKALAGTPGLKGDVVIHFTLKPNGQVKHAELNAERSTITQASVSSCVIDVITSIQFPRSSKGKESNVNYPFNFNPNS